MITKRFTFHLALALLGVLVTAASAWACTGAPTRYDIAPATAAAAQSVRVTGENFGSLGSVEIRWNTVDGPLVGTAPSGAFAIDVQVPAQARPGVFYLVAVQRDASGAVASKSAEVIEVTRANSATSAARSTSATEPGRSTTQDLWSSYSSSNTGDVGTGLVTPEPTNQSASMMLGIALAGVGLLSLLSVLAIVMASRRTAKRTL